MGWDAFATKNKLVIKENGKHDYRIINPEHRRLFKNASNYVKRKAKVVDWLLEHGGLDCSICGEMFQEATGRDHYGPNCTKKEVQKLNRYANWDFEYSEKDAWAYWSARKFLETCAKCNLSIRFSW
jgi:hypothetical protein